MVAVQPRSLITVPVQDRALAHVVLIVQVLRTVASLWNTSLVCAHCPLDVAVNDPLIASVSPVARAGGAAITHASPTTDAVAAQAVGANERRRTFTSPPRVQLVAPAGDCCEVLLVPE